MIPFALGFLGFVAATLPISQLISKRLVVSNDFFFLIFEAQLIIYLHVAPTAWCGRLPPEMQSAYLWLTLGCLVFFEIPLLYLYLGFRGRRHGPRAALQTATNRGAGLAALCAGFAILFILDSVSQNALFVRLGAAGLTQSLQRMSLGAFLIYRLFQVAGGAVIPILMVAAFLCPSRQARLWIWACTFITAAAYVAQRMLNSRLDVALFIVLMVGVSMLFDKRLSISRRQTLVGLVAMLAVGYGYRVAINVRELYTPGNPLQAAMLNPFRSSSKNLPYVDPQSEIALRLNGLDLMAQMMPALRLQGYAWGRAWRIPALVVWNEATMRSSANQAYHAAYLDTAKRNLMVAYTTLTLPDYPSCVLTDAYGNFGFWGMGLLAVLEAGFFGISTRLLQRRSSGVAIVIAIFALQHALAFEQESWTLLAGWVRISPVLVTALMFAPFRMAPEPQGLRTRRLATTVASSWGRPGPRRAGSHVAH